MAEQSFLLILSPFIKYNLFFGEIQMKNGNFSRFFGRIIIQIGFLKDHQYPKYIQFHIQ